MGGFIPDMVLWLTYFYKSNELPIRLAWFWTALSTVNIVGSLVVAGICCRCAASQDGAAGNGWHGHAHHRRVFVGPDASWALPDAKLAPGAR